MSSKPRRKLVHKFIKKLKKTITWSYLFRVGLLAVIYIVAAKLGLSFAYSTEQVTTIWPPTGIALAALLIFGYRYWPGVFIGAFIANFSTDETVLIATGIALGNTLEALTGSYLLRRFINFNGRFSRATDFFGLLILSGCVSTAISATIGTLSLVLGNIVTDSYLNTWLIWWVGDMMGALVLAPLILIYATNRFAPIRQRAPEASLLFALTAATCIFIFAGNNNLAHFLPYLLFPFIIWASIRFKQSGAVVIVCLIVAIATWGTVAKLGPFNTYSYVEKNLILLQTFILVAASTAMMTAIVADQHQKAETALRRRNRDLKEANRRVINLLAGAVGEHPSGQRPKAQSERKKLNGP